MVPKVRLQERLQVDAGPVLGGDEHRLQPDGPAVFVLEADLGLAVRAEVGKHPDFSHLRQALRQTVGQPNGCRHEVVGLVAGVTEHHPLVAGALAEERVLAAHALAHLVGGVDADGDVLGLLADGDGHPAGKAVEAHFRARVADGRDHVADDLGYFDIRAGGDLARHHHQTGGEQGLAGDAGRRVLFEYGVEDGVGNLIGHLVRVPLGHRFGREHPACHP